MRRYSACLAFLLILTGCGGGTQEAPPSQTAGTATSLKAPLRAPLPSTARPGDYYTVVQQLYVAYFGRPADSGGLINFANELAKTAAPKDIQAFNAAYQSNATVRGLIDSFGASLESQELYSGGTSTFVTAIYTNVLNRAPDAAGLKFWVDAIDGGTLSKGNASFSIMAGGLANTSPQGLVDAALINKKILAGSAFTAALTTADRIDAYKGQAAAAAARALLSSVTSQTSASTVQVQVDGVIAQLLSTSTGKPVFHGTVALGNPIKDAKVEIFDADGLIGETLSDLSGKYLLPSKLVRALTPPYIVKAEFTTLGKKVSLFSISTDDQGKNLTINVTPVTDMITRAYIPAPSVPDPMAALYNDPSRLSTITNSVKKVLGPLLPTTAGDPISAPLVADPRVNEWDAALERMKITSMAGETTIRNVNDKIVATVTAGALAAGTAGATDTDTITQTEATEAIAVRADFGTTVQRYVNESATGALRAPPNFRAIQTGALSFKLTWDRVDGAAQYYIFEQKDSEPTITPGRYSIEQTVPTYATGSNSVTDVELEYTVPGSGTYHWVIGAVADDSSFTEYTLGTLSEPVNITFDANKPLTCVTEPLPATSTTGKLSYCYYQTGTPPFTTKKRHGLATYIDNGRLVYQGNYKDGIQDGSWRYYFATAPYGLTTDSVYVDGKVSFERNYSFYQDGSPANTYSEQFWKTGTVKSNYIAIGRYYCATHNAIPENRRGALYSVFTGSDSFTPGTSEKVLKCGPNNASSGETCCTVP